MASGGPPHLARSPAVINSNGLDFSEWISANPDWENLLHAFGFILFRGFDIASPEAFTAALGLLMQPMTDFTEETSPRSAIAQDISTSTDYPREYPIQFHHEFSYRKIYPHRLAFACLRPPSVGGATPIADSRRVLAKIPPYVISRFERLGIAYVRNFTTMGVSWQAAFGSNDKAQVSDYCDRHGIRHSWSEDELRTFQVAPAVVTHPVTGERAWFNSVLNLNVLGIEPKSVRDVLATLPADAVPTNTLYGSGEPIEPDVIEVIRESYTAEALRFDWQQGDLLVIDNILTAHARDPFEGDRHIVVGMG